MRLGNLIKLFCAMLLSAGTSFASAVQTLTFSNELISVMGRAQSLQNGSVLVGYPGVSFSVDVEGTALTLNAQSSSDKTYIEAIIDDQAPQIMRLSETATDYSLDIPTQGSKHRLRIINRSESWHGLVTFNKLDTNGKFISGTKLPNRKMLIVGDSVTCGSSIDRIPDTKPDTSAANPRLSYGMLLASALNTQVQLVCMGGHGLIRTWDGKTNDLNLPEFYQLTYPAKDKQVFWDQKNYQPELIFSAIGTNDFSQGIPEQETYVSTYVKFVLQLLADHKNAQIVLTEGSILNGEKKTALTHYLQETQKRVADKRVHLASSSYYAGDQTDAHPSKEQHALMAKDIYPQIKAIMNW